MMKLIFAVTGIFCYSFFSEGCDVPLKGTGAAVGGTAVFQYNIVPTTGNNVYDVARGTDTAKVRVTYIAGISTGPASVINADITFTGDEATGSISFSFANVASTDKGTYTLTNTAGDELQCITLHILGAVPTVSLTTGSSNTNSLSIETGESVTFTCSATSNADTPVISFTYSWTKDGGALSGETSTSLTIASVAASHAGKYQCTATEDITGGLSSSSNELALAVTGKTDDHTGVIVGVCVGVGVPAVIFLVIVVVLSKSSPFKPEDLLYEEQTGTLKWKHPSKYIGLPKTKITEYRIYQQEVDSVNATAPLQNSGKTVRSGSWQKIGSVEGSLTRYTLGQTDKRIRVCAVSENGEGSPAEISPGEIKTNGKKHDTHV